MNTVVAIIGVGELADLVCREMSALCRIVRLHDFKAGIPEATDFALVLHDAWHPSVHEEAEELLRAAGIPWLRGFIAFGEGVIGPLIRPGLSGCSQCADTRRLLAGRDRKEMLMLQQRLTETGGIPSDAWVSRTGLLQMTFLLVAELQRILQSDRPLSEERMYFIDLKTLKCTSHFFLPDPLCSVCGGLLDDTPTTARISLQPSPKINEKSYRCRSLEDMKGFLIEDYLDYKTGFLNGKMIDLLSPFADVSVNLPMFNQDEATAGRTHSYADSELTAIMEGLERYCGMAPRGKRTMIRDSYRNLADHALNPVTVGLYATDQYNLPDFTFKPFTPDEPIDWVWGYSFERQSPIMVPQQLAYYSSSCGQGFVYETSNGCALGGTLEEAIFYGIMEVVERDSFLLTWYAQLPLPRLDPLSAGDLELELMVSRLQTVAGFELHLYNATMENGIPSVWALAKNTKTKGVNLICAAGAHPDPVRAAKSAIHELSGMMLTLDEKFEANRERYVQMFHDPSLVLGMEDHSMLYSLPQAEERLKFLLEENRPLRTFQEEFNRTPTHSDLTDDLKDVLLMFRQLNLDVIVVDQTTPELKRNELYCVKVLIPGMLPMTFGYHLTRVTELERVLKVPALLGYVKQPLLLEQLNPHPHPFP
ncbi:TOMM precursor leader peptide-binding protein [Paenibacillus radicis (ex Xue et al. 2023)]|uniref:TOMM leader peptide-binding protein n=1 Tax=Paenibacillus radicis (ex Xue et al. 2023) TaxID=2972489 RepID=A0ABT1YBI8_9BACL|nr:TOMM precursor leader peptide-binding protein [Paenibacillus radicis (ex Xue et al. 2023)]MCR8630125.1 TOMM precursor leader peptide-binding protein [Paenibacillus radicis (ex Xue et al. 2023)]